MLELSRVLDGEHDKIMWYGLVLIILIETGDSGVMVNTLPSYSENACKKTLKFIGMKYQADIEKYFTSATCIFLPEGESI